ncbi:MAG: efflux RND transporter periplasmic adaptor subunit [Candidatus Eisenbacteria bacterium]|nr:efflux RND transporter periplasmic adaptor subunit [Candidatus Eisenbacteria bacterium]
MRMATGRKVERRARWIGTVLSIPLALAAWSAAGCSREEAGPNPSGTLEAAEIDIAPSMTGKALEVRADLGDRVAAGDTLVVLDTELLVLQRAEAEANRRSLMAQRSAAEEDRKQAERALALAEKTLGRLRALLADGTATEQQVDDAEAKRDQIVNQREAARHRVAMFDAEMEKLAASLAVFDRQIRDGVLLSPENGVVLVRALEPGEIALPNRPALRIADLSRLDLRVYLEAEDLGRVRIGEKVPVLVDALGGKEVEGKVVWVSPEAEFTPKNVQTRNARAQLVYAVKIEVENADGILAIGMPAEARLARERPAGNAR